MYRARALSVNRMLAVLGFILLAIIMVKTAYGTSPTNALTTEESSRTSTDDVALHLSKVRNISIEEARIRAEWQNRAGELNDKLILELPKNDFGGMWIDKDTDRVKVGVLNGSKLGGASRDAVAQEVNKSGLNEAVDYVSVEHSYYELRESKEWISQTSQEREAKTDWPLQVGLTPNTNQVLVRIPADETKRTESLKAVVADIQTRYSDMVATETYKEPASDAAECNWWFCNSPLRGGVGIKGSVGGYEDGIDCTAGFNVVGNSGTRYVVTAGHCAPAGSGWATETYNYTTKKIGPIHGTLYGQNGIDAMIVEIKESTYNWDVMGKILVRGGDHGMNGYDSPSYNEEYDITDSGSSGSLVGERVCVSGAIMGGYPSEPNGGSCGAVHEVDVNLTINGITSTNLVRAGLCVRAGDSGGPVFRLGKALGIVKGGDLSTACNNDKYYTGMNPIINGFNGNISIF